MLQITNLHANVGDKPILKGLTLSLNAGEIHAIMGPNGAGKSTLGYVLCGGDLSAPTEVSEQYLLDLERDAFLSLCGEKKTLERIQSILTTGKVLRN